MYYIEHIAKGTIYSSDYSWNKRRYTEQGAKMVCTKLNKKAGEVIWRTVSVAEYAARPVKMVERINLMSGNPYMEAEDTPNFMSPSSETYWSM